MSEEGADRGGRGAGDEPTAGAPAGVDPDEALARSIPPLDTAAREAARERGAELTKPPGSLGRLETAAADIAGMQATETPRVDPAVVVTMAADHGVVAEGVSAYPQSITAAMVANIRAGGAAINAICGAQGIETVVVDMGLAGGVDNERAAGGNTPGDTDESDDAPARVIEHRIGEGTENMARGPAMTTRQARRSIAAGRRVVADDVVGRGRAVGAVGLGEMGIGNTTACAAITAVVTGESVESVTGHGTGIDEATRARKIATIERAIETTDPDPADPVDVLRCVGGFEIGGLVGLTLEAASRRIPVVVDGVVTGAAALLAAEVDPRVTDYLLGSHESVEPGHATQLDALGIEPWFDYGMRLGEGTGAALAVGVYRAACAAHTGMATFAEAGLDGG